VDCYACLCQAHHLAATLAWCHCPSATSACASQKRAHHLQVDLPLPACSSSLPERAVVGVDEVAELGQSLGVAASVHSA